MSKHFMPSVALAALMAARPAGIIGTVRNESQNIEKLLGEVKQELERVGSNVKQTAEEALKQAKESGTLTAETKQKADELLMAQGRLSAAQDKLTERLESLETKSTDIEQRMASRRGGGGDSGVKSLGQMVGASDDLKNFVAVRGAKGSVRVVVKNAITSATGSAGALIVPERDTEIVGMPKRQMTIRQLLSVGPTTSNSIEYARMVTRTNNAAATAETAQKPESNYVWEQDDAPVRTIAHWVPVSRQAMDDIPQLESEIDGELRYGLDLVEEAEILKGDGTGQHLHGLVPQATAYANPGVTVINPTKIDILRLAILQASLAEYPADGIVLHPTDWADIELTKDGENRYIFANVIQLAGPQLWGRPVIGTQAMDLDEFLVGAFRTAAKIWDRMDIEVLISSEDRDNFIKNMLTVRAEKRLALAVKRPGALVTGDFTTALTP
ncbi:phage major capsid protein [Brucella anthropi]|uniref:phage major capsid protein n=1 Tax=Brucella/Ochrobactrum group TaxID=2826938 RepID=UPI00124C7B28|nr:MULTISPECIES: phage major capsid protein [Brucella/Ochrobactrum group]KAB2764782.1 phage major capsid protein [Brucella anthropi]KAB2782547.1 phage major capsid protein [Brucella anthropi]MCQ9143328.1 phage major capsid protein [Ochrobactrum sp. BTU2]UGQ23863.1 phage major capsid protein [Brucella anthropi]